MDAADGIRPRRAGSMTRSPSIVERYARNRLDDDWRQGVSLVA
jgi:hypothetical protein